MTGIRKNCVFSVFSSAILIVVIGHVLSVQAHAASSSPTAAEFLQTFPQGPADSLAAGKFLVADRSIRDSLFAEAVILLVDYGPEGAMGLVINHPTDVKLADLLPNLKGAMKRHDTIHIGGPVGINQIFVIIRSDGNPEESLHVFGTVYVSTSETLLDRMIAKPGKGEKFLLYAGYSGWSAGQLEREVARGDWHVIDADAQSIFDKKPSAVWKDLIERSSGQWVNTRDGRLPLFLTRPALLSCRAPNPPVED